MKRERKHRVWHTESLKMLYGTSREVFAWEEERQPVIIMEYCGLKDKNGKEVYEGDIVRARGKVAKVERRIGGTWTYYFQSAKNENTLIGRNLVREELDEPVDRRGRIRDVEVIGNIYENPELLQP